VYFRQAGTFRKTLFLFKADKNSPPFVTTFTITNPPENIITQPYLPNSIITGRILSFGKPRVCCLQYKVFSPDSCHTQTHRGKD
jgi:hypothetical protein